MAPDDQRPDQPNELSAPGRGGGPDLPDVPLARPADAVQPYEVAPSTQPPTDPEAWRRFQEFQQFQQFQDYQRQYGQQPGAGPLPPPVPGPPPVGPATGRPLWQRVVRGKLFRRLVLLVLLLLALNWAYQHYFGTPDEDLPASQTGGGQTRTNLLLEKTPEQAVRKVYDNIAQNIPNDACTRFSDETRQQFADHFGGGACAEVISDLHAKVTDANSYAESIPAVLSGVSRSAPQVEISSCAAGIAGGPALGVFTVKQIELGQWLIIEHRLEPVCKGAGQTSGPTSGPRPTA